MAKDTKKKRRVVVVIAIVIAAMLLVPYPIFYKDGGTVILDAVLYGVTMQHSIAVSEENGKYVSGYDIGTIVRILWFEVYNDVKFVPDEL